MIELHNVSKTFHSKKGSVEALRNINLTVDEGEFITLVGRSGCGKTTLLRLIAGLLQPTAGQLSVSGQKVAKPRRDVAVMFQRPALLPWRTVLENLMLPVEVIGAKKSEYLGRAEELLDTTSLTGFEDALPRELSGGMQQRVSLCRSLITDPDVLLMDEPFASLDALTREELSSELQRICLDQQKTVVFVTHSIDEAVLLADRAVVLSPRPGQIKQIVDVDVPKPRSLGHSDHTERLAEIGAELRDLLFEPAEARP